MAKTVTHNYLKTLLPFVSALIISLLLSWSACDFLSRTEAQISDKEWQWIARDAAVERRIIIVDIDETSTVKYGTWPWPREQVAELSRRINTLGASLQIIDIIFTAEQAGDTLLAAEFKQHPTVLAEILALKADDATQAGTLVAGQAMEKCTQYYPEANAYIANNSTIAASTPAAGHITPHIDSDGIVRRLPAFICQNNKAYPALALAALATAIGSTDNFELHTSDAWWQAEHTLRHPELPEIAIPLSAEHDILLPWWLPRTALTSISATEILAGTVDKELLQGAWVIMGSSAFGTGDTLPTPQAKIVDGVEVHVQLLSALLDNKIPYQPQGAGYLQALWILAISGFMALLLKFKGRLAIYAPPLLGLSLAALTLLIQAQLLANLHIWLSAITVILYTLLLGCFLAIKGYADTWVENQRLYKNLSSYLPKHAAKLIASQDPISTMAAHHEQVFVMYVDLRNFSNWCEQLPAEQIGAILHSFYKTVTETVHQHGGQTEKYIGDAVLAVWREDDQGILPAAQLLLQNIEQLFGEESSNQELPPLGLGIGIEKGEILAGSFGPAQRREYAILGKTVSTAIQLQEMTIELALPILIGEQAAQQWHATENLETQGKFMLTGLPSGMEIFTPV